MPANTPSYNFYLPTVGGDTNAWGGYLNSNWSDVDDLLDGTTPVSGIDINGGTIDGTPIGATVTSTGAFSSATIGGAALTSALIGQWNTAYGWGNHATAGYAALAGAAFTGNITPTPNDGAALGTGLLSWSDLFLASGAVLNFNNGNVVITHATGEAQLTTGNFNFLDKQLIRPLLKDYGEITNAMGAGGGARSIDLALGNSVSCTVSTSTTTFSFTNPTASDELCGFLLMLTNGGSQTVNWPASVTWVSGAAPSLTAAGLDALVFFTQDGGTNWYGVEIGLDI